MSQLALACPLILQIKRKRKEKKNNIQNKRKEKEKENNNDLAVVASHDSPLTAMRDDPSLKNSRGG